MDHGTQRAPQWESAARRSEERGSSWSQVSFSSKKIWKPRFVYEPNSKRSLFIHQTSEAHESELLGLSSSQDTFWICF